MQLNNLDDFFFSVIDPIVKYVNIKLLEIIKILDNYVS